MSIWAIADTHLSFGTDKPMDIFGPQWADHAERLRTAWLSRVAPEDTVLIPGDVSWGMTLDEALPDLTFLDQLPGQVILGRGNHDYWWSTLSKMTAYIAEKGLTTLTFQRNDACIVPLAEGRAIIAGSRGWTLPNDPTLTAQDQKIYAREVQRLTLSLTQAAKLRTPSDLLIAQLHYPPLAADGTPTPIADLLTQFHVDRCLFGHVHGPGHRTVFTGTQDGVTYTNIASDYLTFQPLLIAQ